MQGKQAWDDGQQLADKQCGADTGSDGGLDWGFIDPLNGILKLQILFDSLPSSLEWLMLKREKWDVLEKEHFYRSFFLKQPDPCQ